MLPIEKRYFRKNLLRWYHTSKRSLPWRKTRDPYKILISEILLQQTRVESATDYYRAFIRKFPSLPHLARAKQESVLQVWQGLGYYGRARNLHSTARILMKQAGGNIPEEPDALMKLPGIGPYTAAAVASIAFDRDVPVLDGNVARVLCRFFSIEEDPKSPSTRRRLHEIACQLLPTGKASSFNQALMELGALVCKPGRPACSSCPLMKACHAFSQGKTLQLPLRSPKTPLGIRHRITAVVRVYGRYLFNRRPPEGLLGGLWEFPGIYKDKRESRKAAVQRLEKKIQAHTGTHLKATASPFVLKHTYSHFQEELVVIRYIGKRRPGYDPPREKKDRNRRWIHPNHLKNYPITGATRKILLHMAKQQGLVTPNSKGG